MTFDRQARLDDAFERIEETILPCLTMLLDSMLDATAALATPDHKCLAAELRTLATEIDGLTEAVGRHVFQEESGALERFA